MKKVFVFFSMLAMSLGLMAQQPVITFAKMDHDFGKIKEEGGKVSTVFEFKNEGMAPLVLTNVKASCGCTTPTWTKTPVEPGETGTITVTYNPNGRPGVFHKSINVTCNAENSPVRLQIRGEVIPKPVKPVNKYPVQMGELTLTEKIINFGSMLNTDSRTKVIEYANQTDHDLMVEVLTDPETSSYLFATATLPVVKPGETGKISVNLDAKQSHLWGAQTFAVYVKVNGKRVLTDEYKITINASIDEDFSQLTTEQKQQAPIVEVRKEINLGTIKRGTIVKEVLSLKNVGGGLPLLVRNISDPMPGMLKIVAGKGAIKTGKKMDIKLELDTRNMEPQHYRRELVIQTNDPQNPKVKVVLGWTIE